MERILLFVLIMSAQLNAAQVYKCTVNDAITFSDQSCSAPESVKVVNHFMRWKQDESGTRQLLVLEAKAKNGYGAYYGTTFSECFLDHNDTGLSTFNIS